MTGSLIHHHICCSDAIVIKAKCDSIRRQVESENFIFDINSHQEEDRVEEGDGKQSVEVDVPWEENDFLFHIKKMMCLVRKISSSGYYLSIYVIFFHCALKKLMKGEFHLIKPYLSPKVSPMKNVMLSSSWKAMIVIPLPRPWSYPKKKWQYLALSSNEIMAQQGTFYIDTRNLQELTCWTRSQKIDNIR